MGWRKFFLFITICLMAGIADFFGFYSNSQARSSGSQTRINPLFFVSFRLPSGSLFSPDDGLDLKSRAVRNISPVLSSCTEKEGKIEKGSMSSPSLTAPLKYRIYLPPCYEQEPEKRYPVLFLLHGRGYKEDQWDRIGADETANSLIRSKAAPPFIIVMPQEFTSDKIRRTNFGQILAKELVPHIDKQYRTIPERKYRAIGGLSRGAGWAVIIGIQNWELFDTIGAHSMAILNDDWNKMNSLLDAIPLDSFPAIYIDTGNKDLPSILDSARWFGDMLNQKGLPHEWYLFTGLHDEVYWSRHVDGYLRWYTSNW